MTDVPASVLRAYRLLLRAYPRDFRDDVGEEMVAMFADRWREARRRGARGLAALIARTAFDVARNAAAERLRPHPERLTMDALLWDLRYALRSLFRRPGFLAVAVLTLALGVGANVAIFSVVHATLLRPLPYPDPDQLVMIWTRSDTVPQAAASYPELEDWRRESKSFSGLAGWRGQSINLSGSGDPERLVGAFITHDFHPLLGLQPLLGRPFRAEETRPGTAEPVALISYGLWQRRFGADPAILGKPLVLNGKSHIVVGVMGPEIAPDRPPAGGWFNQEEVWLPLPYFPNAKGMERGQREVLTIGRLAPGVSVEQARAELGSVAAGLGERHVEQRGFGVKIDTLTDTFLGRMRDPIFALFIAVTMVLLIACVNVANLLLARASHREKELAVRSALGAGRRRLARQLLTESVVLGILGGLAGLAASVWVLKLVLAVAPRNFGLPADVTIDPPVMLYTLAVAVGTALLFGVVPALRASRPDVNGVLKGGAQGGRRTRFRDALVVLEGGLSLMLLVGATLLLRSAVNLAGASPGFRTDHLLTFEFRLPPAKYSQPAQIAAFFREIDARISAIPGVESVGLARAVPFGGNEGQTAYTLPGRDAPAPGHEKVAQTNLVSPGWFATLGIPVRSGRAISTADRADTVRACVINELMATHDFAGEEPLGKQIQLKGIPTPCTVVGVVGDIRHGALSEAPLPQIYGAHEQNPMIFTGVVVRTAGDPMAMMPSVREAIWSVDREQPVWKTFSMDTLLARHRQPSRSLAMLMAVFAAVAVALAGVGLYGVMSYAVAQRTREIGIRMALGASARRVVGDVVRRGMLLAALALALGLAGALALRTVLSGLLWGVGSFDPIAVGGAAAVLLVVSFVAAYVPARRAARVEPTVALAQE